MAIIKNNVQNVRFLRNGNLFSSRQEANEALTDYTLAAEMDGSAILARYSGTTTGETQTTFIKTLVGFVYYEDANNKSITIFDVDDAGSDVDNKIKAAIQALDSDATSIDGTNVQVKVTETDGKITAVNITTDNTVNSGDVDTAITTAISNLDYSGVTTGEGVYVTNVTEADGVIAATTATLPTVVAISEAGKPITAVSESLGAISATVGTINAEYVDVSYSAITATNVKGALAEIADEIDAMDKSASAEDGQVVTTISETDGVVSETKANVKDLQLGGYVKGEQSGAISGTDTINIALSKIENNIAASQSATTVTNTDHSINVTTAATGTTIGVNIKSGEEVISLGNDGIYTDIKLSAVTVSEANVKEAFALIASNGTTKLGSTIKIYKDSSLLSVELLHADTTAKPQVLPTYDKVSGWTDIAETAQTQANQALCFAYENVEGTVVKAAVPVGSFINEQEFASGLTWDAVAGKVKGVVDSNSESFLTVGEGGFRLAGVQNAIDAKVNALDATVGSQTVATGKHVAVEVVEANGVLTAVTVTESNIANADDLTNEIAARKAVDGQNGQTYVANSGKAYISGATSLNDADIKLNDALASLDADVIKSVEVNGVALAETSNAVNVQISSVAASGATSSPIVVNTDNSTGAVTLQILQIDCGEY